MREDLQQLKNVAEGRTVFILGGGASVTPEMIERLNQPKTKVFCLNSSVKFITNPIAVLWCDDSWAATNKDLLDAYKFPKFAVRSNGANYIPKDIRTQSNATVIAKTGQIGFDHNIDNVKGNNSGCYAINLLVNCKVKEIVLVGFDMYSTGNKAHFHTDYTYSIRPSVYSDMFIPAMEQLNKELSATGIGTKIYNTNFASGLKCFEFRELWEF